MTIREKCQYIVDRLPEKYLQDILPVLEEADDDAYCEKLYQEYEADPDKGEFITIEEFSRELGISLES